MKRRKKQNAEKCGKYKGFQAFVKNREMTVGAFGVYTARREFLFSWEDIKLR